jgi:hypothetical protein
MYKSYNSYKIKSTPKLMLPMNCEPERERGVKADADHSKSSRTSKCDLQALDQELDTSTPTRRLIFHVLAVIGEFERELLEMLDSVVISKEDLARQFNVSRATVYRLAAKLDKDFVEQAQQG